MGFIVGVTINPAPGTTLMSRQGMRPGRSAWHNGLDLGASTGTPIFPAAAGTVQKIVSDCLSEAARAAMSSRDISRRGGPCQCSSTYGNYVVVKHADNFLTVYAHLDVVLVREGQVVATTTQLGTLGATTALPNDRCLTMAPHLHFEVVKSWPLSSRDTESRYDVLHELAVAGVNLSGDRLVATGIPTDYYEPALSRIAKAAVTADVDFSPAPLDTPLRGKLSKWPLYVAVGAGVLAVTSLLTWALVRRRRSSPGGWGQPPRPSRARRVKL